MARAAAAWPPAHTAPGPGPGNNNSPEVLGSTRSNSPGKQQAIACGWTEQSPSQKGKISFILFSHILKFQIVTEKEGRGHVV